MAITAAQVKELRERTGCGMMDCKKALVECDGNMEKAIDALREKGLAKAAKKAERNAKDGLMFSHISDDGKVGVLVELDCETDFVARNEEFQDLGKNICLQIAGDAACDCGTEEEKITALLAKPWIKDASADVNSQIVNLIAKIGENMKLHHFARFAAEGVLFNYIHNTGKVGVMVELACDNADVVASDAFKQLGHDICLHIAAANPNYRAIEDVPAEDLEREKAIYRQQLIDEGKPADRVEKILTGKMRKFYELNCLLEQFWIKDDSVQIKKLLAQVDKSIKITRYVRYAIGA